MSAFCAGRGPHAEQPRASEGENAGIATLVIGLWHHADMSEIRYRAASSQAHWLCASQASRFELLPMHCFQLKSVNRAAHEAGRTWLVS